MHLHNKNFFLPVCVCDPSKTKIHVSISLKLRVYIYIFFLFFFCSLQSLESQAAERGDAEQVVLRKNKNKVSPQGGGGEESGRQVNFGTTRYENDGSPKKTRTKKRTKLFILELSIFIIGCMHGRMGGGVRVAKSEEDLCCARPSFRKIVSIDRRSRRRKHSARHCKRKARGRE
jgi:hypothetical protein